MRTRCTSFLRFRPEALYHQAAQMSVCCSVREPDFDAEVNVLGTLRLLGNCVCYSVEKVVFTTTRRQALEKGRVVYVLIDSLGYEMARDLARTRQDDYEVHISPALATVPTITEIAIVRSVYEDGEKTARSVEVYWGRTDRLGLSEALKYDGQSPRKRSLQWLLRLK